MDMLNADQIQEENIRNLKKTIEQQSTLIEQQLAAIEFGNRANGFLRRQQKAFIDVLEEYRRSRWPWIRWVAERMYKEVHERTIAQIQREVKSGYGFE